MRAERSGYSTSPKKRKTPSQTRAKSQTPDPPGKNTRTSTPSSPQMDNRASSTPMKAAYYRRIWCAVGLKQNGIDELLDSIIHIKNKDKTRAFFFVRYLYILRMERERCGYSRTTHLIPVAGYILPANIIRPFTRTLMNSCAENFYQDNRKLPSPLEPVLAVFGCRNYLDDPSNKST